jgi:hydroxymethylpyrimidine pyrophosphatase-like HAD family hydrolase
VLVTGRELADLLRIFPALDLFERVVAENGALLYRPTTRELLALAAPPPEPLVELLRRKGVTPLAVGRVVLATYAEHEALVGEAVQELGLDLQLIRNREALMILPTEIDKGTGLGRALDELAVTTDEVIGIGDAENDETLLGACGYGVAVANAVPVLKARAQFVTAAPGGLGVLELIETLLAPGGML